MVILGVVYLRDNSGPEIHTAAGRSIIVEPTGNTPIADSEDTAEAVPADIVVHIEGAVNQPGVYTVSYGSRVNDILVIAGGATEEADLSRINLAAFLEDAQQIIIPVLQEEGNFEANLAPESMAAQAGSGGLVNVNTADQAQLVTLPGVGPVLAGNIIAYREVHGPFATVDDLRNVPRIGEVTLENLRDLVTVN